MTIKPYYLSRDEVERLRNMEDDINVLRREIARAERAGIDISDLKEKFNHMVALREGLLREYTPPEMK